MGHKHLDEDGQLVLLLGAIAERADNQDVQGEGKCNEDTRDEDSIHDLVAAFLAHFARLAVSFNARSALRSLVALDAGAIQTAVAAGVEFVGVEGRPPVVGVNLDVHGCVTLGIRRAPTTVNVIRVAVLLC